MEKLYSIFGGLKMLLPIKHKMLSVKKITTILLAVGLLSLQANVFPREGSINSKEIQQVQQEIEGKVTDPQGVPMPGVDIVEKGTLNGTVTNLNGEYSITVESPEAVLVFSFVGYLSQEIQVGNRTIIDVTLEEDILQLEEVVVTALGIRKETKALTYSVTEVEGDELMRAQETNVGEALIGKIAGVDVTAIGGGIAGSNKIVIRGNNSLTGNNDPLIVLDGVPIDNDPRSGWGGRDYGDGLAAINPNDIESISVLKGNTAAALYGYRAANGVVMITTKRGVPGAGVGVEVNSSYTYDQPVITFDAMHDLYGQGLGHEKPTDWGYETHRTWGAKFDGSQAYYPDGTPVSYDAKEFHFREFFRDGYTFQNSVALSGGNEQQTYRLSVSDLRNNHIVPNSDQRRNTVSLNTTGKFGKRLTVSTKINYTNQDVHNRPVTSSIYSNYVQAMMVMPANWEIEHFKGPTDKWGAKEDGTHYMFSTNDWFTNPYWSAYQYDTRDITDRVIASGTARYDIFSWLYIQGRIGTDFGNVKITEITPYGTAHVAPAGQGRVEESTRKTRETNMEYMIGGDKEFGDFGVNAFFGGSRMRRDYENVGASATYLSIPFYHVLSNGSVQEAIYGFNQREVNSLYGSAEFSFRKYLFLTVTGRNDWYSTLNPENNSKFYYSGGLSFLLSDAVELPDWISFAKLRISQAQVGGGGTTPYQTKFSYNVDAIGHLGVPLASIPNTLSNPNLTPYLSTETEFGADLRLFQNRIGIDYAYYIRNSIDHIINADYPMSAGYTSGKVNLGEVKNWGHEVLLTGRPLIGEMIWDVTLAVSYNMSEVIEAGETDEVQIGSASVATKVRHIEGDRYGAILGYKQQRLDDGTKVWEYNAGRETWAPARESDLSVLGYGYHPWTGSLNNQFSWKGFDLSFLIDWKFGGSFFSETNYLLYLRGNHLNTIGKGIEGIEPVNGVDREEGINLLGVDTEGNPGPFHVPNNKFENFYRRLYSNRITELNVYDASFIKFRQIVFGYNLPASLMDNLPIRGIRISFIARNLGNLYDKVDNVDPAFSNTGSGNDQGLEKYAMLPIRNFGLNLNVKF